jgi:glycosyltransferase involved in cell wall biosynthesis
MTAKSLAGAIQRLLDDPERAARMAVAGRRQFEAKLSWRNVGARRLVDAYQGVFGPPSPSA